MEKTTLHIITTDHESGQRYIIDYRVGDDTPRIRELSDDGEREVPDHEIPKSLEDHANSIIRMLLGN